MNKRPARPDDLAEMDACVEKRHRESDAVIPLGLFPEVIRKAAQDIATFAEAFGVPVPRDVKTALTEKTEGLWATQVRGKLTYYDLELWVGERKLQIAALAREARERTAS